MIPAPRIAVIDDEIEHIKAIRVALEKMGTSCLPILVDAGVPSVDSPIRGIRLLFLDVHLINPVMDGAALFDANGSILKQVISEKNGPYVLVVWTSDKGKRDGLLAHISEYYPEIPKPLASLLMAKEDYFSDGSFDIEKVSRKISDLLDEQPQATALLHWENAVDLAAGELIGKLCEFVERKKLFLGSAKDDLEIILTAIAQSAAGHRNVRGNELSSINEGLMPLLFDSLIHLPDSDGILKEKWGNAIAKPDDEVKLDPGKKAKLNSMYHLASDIESLKCGARGAVYEITDESVLDSLFPGFWPNEILSAFFNIKDAPPESIAALRADLKWCLIGLRPACDQAQAKPGMFRVVLASITPERFAIRGVGHASTSPAIYPSVLLNRSGGDFVMRINFNFLASLTDSHFVSLKITPNWRLRDSICSDIETHFSNHASRPGIISIR